MKILWRHMLKNNLTCKNNLTHAYKGKLKENINKSKQILGGKQSYLA